MAKGARVGGKNATIRSPELCIGIPSVQRSGISYLKATLGSLQHGLSNEERDRLRFVVLLAHTNQTQHTDHGESWLVKMADSLPSYHDSAERLALAMRMEENRSHAVKSKFDYSILMEECAKSAAPYMLLVEDDVVFLDGWRHRTIKAISTAMMKSWEAAHSDCAFFSSGEPRAIAFPLPNLRRVAIGKRRIIFARKGIRSAN